MYASTTQAMWEKLLERFNKVDGSRVFNLHKEIATLSQGTTSVSNYFSRLKTLWEEFEALTLLPTCNCPRSKEFVIHLQKMKLFQFLMGRNESYNQARGQILLVSPIPIVNQACAMLLSDESQKSAAMGSGILGANPSVYGNANVAMYMRKAGSYYGTTAGPSKFKKNFNLQCDFCKMKGHVKDN